MSVCPCVRMEQLGFHWTDFDETDIWDFYENWSRKLKFY
jgi:hypothetical protein